MPASWAASARRRSARARAMLARAAAYSSAIFFTSSGWFGRRSILIPSGFVFRKKLEDPFFLDQDRAAIVECRQFLIFDPVVDSAPTEFSQGRDREKFGNGVILVAVGPGPRLRWWRVVTTGTRHYFGSVWLPPPSDTPG